MKLVNKKTGEIKEFALFDGDELQGGATLESLTKEWEDVAEPKVGYIIDPMEEDCLSVDDSGYEEADVERAKELGMWFETKEEAQKVAEKMKAWQRLKDKGFRFCGNGGKEIDTIKFDYGESGYNRQDFALLFGEEE